MGQVGVSDVLICISSLQDLIIEAIYAGVIQAKLDQKNARVREAPGFIPVLTSLFL